MEIRCGLIIGKWSTIINSEEAKQKMIEKGKLQFIVYLLLKRRKEVLRIVHWNINIKQYKLAYEINTDPQSPL